MFDIYTDSREERCAVTAYKSFWAFETNLAEVHNASKMATGMEKKSKKIGWSRCQATNSK